MPWDLKQFSSTCWAASWGSDPSAFMITHRSNGSFFWHGSSLAFHSALCRCAGVSRDYTSPHRRTYRRTQLPFREGRVCMHGSPHESNENSEVGCAWIPKVAVVRDGCVVTRCVGLSALRGDYFSQNLMDSQELCLIFEIWHAVAGLHDIDIPQGGEHRQGA